MHDSSDHTHVHVRTCWPAGMKGVYRNVEVKRSSAEQTWLHAHAHAHAHTHTRAHTPHSCAHVHMGLLCAQDKCGHIHVRVHA